MVKEVKKRGFEREEGDEEEEKEEEEDGEKKQGFIVTLEDSAVGREGLKVILPVEIFTEGSHSCFPLGFGWVLSSSDIGSLEERTTTSSSQERPVRFEPGHCVRYSTWKVVKW